MALSPLRGLPIVALRVFDGREKQEKMFRKRQLLPGSRPAASKKMGHQWTPSGACFKRGNFTGRRTIPLLACRQDPAQTVGTQDTEGPTAPLSLPKVGQSPKFLLHRKISQILWVWWLKTDAALGPLPSTQPPSLPRGVQGDGSGREYIAVIFSRFRIPAYSGKTYPSQVSVVCVEGRPHQSRITSPDLCPLWAT